jgi:hypothetical protein
MNQDETTKSLSDKVLDRSIIIHFPRPTTLERRLELKTLPPRELLPRKTWESWWAKKSDFTSEEIEPFKKFIEKMNDALAVSGRAIGHRVWQSIEYYMANYPDVRAAKDKVEKEKALRTAFEDQLVQKVMPKLRGIDTRGKSSCLDKIRGQLTAGIGGKTFNLNEDFDLALELGYGQFIWQSANYLNPKDETNLKDETPEAPKESATNKTVTATTPKIDDNAPQNKNVLPEEPLPEWFRPDDAKRLTAWQKRTPEQRKKLIADHEAAPKK